MLASKYLLPLFALTSPLNAQLTSGPKLGGGGENPLFPSFINQDKAWYQDARQAYHGDDLVGADGTLSKLDWFLTYTAFQAENAAATNPGQPFTPDTDRLPYNDGNVLLEIVCEGNETWMTVEPALANLGATNITHDGQVINAWLPLTNAGEASQIAGIEFIRPAYRETRAGLTVSQGDRAITADLGRAITPGVTGAGITIGTLSDSFAMAPAPATTAPQDIANGDLPAEADLEILSEFGQPATDEGRAMMQIIRDVAPGAAQKFFTAFNGQADFANGIRALDQAGCDIIVDDVFFFAEPFFQNGLIAQAVNEVTANGKAYFSAAGNSARQSYESEFRFAEGFSGRSGGPLHDFDPGPGTDAFLDFTIPVGSSLTFVLQWDEPFFSVSGEPGCGSDIDVFLTGSGNGQFTAIAGAFASNQGGDAVEIFTFTNQGNIDIDGQPGPDTRFNLVIEGLAGNAPGLMKILFLDRGGFTLNEFDTQSGTLVGHANAQSAIAVAAAFFFQTPAFGTNPPQLESFSSPGGSSLLFADDGIRLAEPLDTEQPRFTSADGANTTFFGQQINDGDAFPNFFGTSAAAPHAAAVAALMLEANGGSGSLSPAEIDLILRSTAIDMGIPGEDRESGAGLIDTLATIELLQDFGFDTPSVVTFLEENALGDPLLPDILMDQANESWLNATVWDNDQAPSEDFDYVLARVGNNTMRTSPAGGTAGGNADFPGNSLTITDGTRLLVKQQRGETASINSGTGDLILSGGRLGFGPNDQRSEPSFTVRNFRITGNTNPIVEISNFVSEATINGLLTGDCDFRVQLGNGSPSGGVTHRLTFTEVDEEGLSSQISLRSHVTLEFRDGAIFRGGAGLAISGNGVLKISKPLAFQEGKLSDPANGTIAPGVYFAPGLASFGANYETSRSSALIISNQLTDTDNDGLLDALERFLIDFDETDSVTSLADVDETTDFDQDGLLDHIEFASLTSDPRKFDTDGDGANDKLEIDTGADPFNALSNPNIRPQISLQPRFENGALESIFFEITDLDPTRTYRLRRSTDLVDFSTIIGGILTGSSEVTTTITDDFPPAGSAFYRVEPF